MSCSNIDENDRFLFVETIAVDTVAKHVLIEDYTGQACVNCPAATELIYSLQEAYGEENVIAVGLYSGPFGQTTSGRYYPLTTDVGNYYFDKFGVDGQPSAMINRHSPNNVTATWATEVYNRLQEEATVAIDIATTYDEDDSAVTITVSATATELTTAQLQVWLTEDGIVNRQYLDDGSYDEDYVHNHVFRATVNDRDGDAVTLGEETTTYTYTADIDTDWVAEKMHVVAFVFTNSDVLQVTQAPVIADNSTTTDDINE